VHDERNRALACVLAAMRPPDFPAALGVLYCDPRPSYEAAVEEQAKAAGAVLVRDVDLGKLLRGGRTWTVTA
jgi:2-oxoglutarate ferredoxin oxidoreductase subunit beta